MTGRDILCEAFKYTDYVYWYGGKDNKCTYKLLQGLYSAYPNIYTSSYIAKCKKDIQAGKRCIDCSGLVCKAYKYAHIGSSQIKDKMHKLKPSQALPGMVLWRQGHVAIVIDSEHIIEAKGVDYDVAISKRNNSAFTFALYDPSVDYVKEYEKGWHSDNIGKWYAWGEFKGCYWHDCLKKIDDKYWYFDSEGYVVE